MARFRKKPQDFEAEQFGGFYDTPWPTGVFVDENNRCYVITAHHQRVYLEKGDWIVREPNGSGYYPIKPEIMPTIADKLEG